MPTVLLDQNISVRKLASALFSAGIRVIRTLNHDEIPDEEIAMEAGKYGAVIITMDNDFERHPRALVSPPRRRLKQNYEPLVKDVRYILGLVEEPSYRNGNLYSNNGKDAESRYHGRLESLRQRIKKK